MLKYCLKSSGITKMLKHLINVKYSTQEVVRLTECTKPPKAQ